MCSPMWGPGTGSHQWLTLLYVTRLLVRIGADTEASVSHDALVDADQEPPLSAAQVGGLGGGVGVALTGAEAVDLARTTLRRYS